MGDNSILGGDFYAKNIICGSRLTTTKGRKMHAAANGNVRPYHLTGKPTDRNNIPDRQTRKIPGNFIKIEENFDLDSDHFLAIMILNPKIN